MELLVANQFFFINSRDRCMIYILDFGVELRLCEQDSQLILTLDLVVSICAYFSLNFRLKYGPS